MHDSYWAGLFDGGGWVRISGYKPNKKSNHTRYQIMMGITMTHRPVLELIHQEFGGSFSTPKTPPKNPNHRNSYGWTLASQKAVVFLKRIRPYSIVKAKEIDVALELQRHIDENPYHPGVVQPNRQELLNYRQLLCLEIRALKKQDFNPFVPNDP